MVERSSSEQPGDVPGTVAVRRALAILRSFEGGDAEKRLSDIVKETGLSASTAHRLLAALAADGFILHNPDAERYRLGPALIVLGQRGASEAKLHEAQDALSELTSATGESATLAVRADLDAVVVAVSASRQRLHFEHAIGGHLALHASAMGKVLLAAEPDIRAAVEALGVLEAYTAHTIVEPARLVAELQQVSERGWAINREERFDAVGGIAAAVLDEGGRVVAAIGIQGPAARLDFDGGGRLVAAVVAAGERLRGRLDLAGLR